MKRSFDNLTGVHNDVNDDDDNDHKHASDVFGITLDQCWHVFDQLDHATKQRVLVAGLGQETVTRLATHYVDDRTWYNVMTIIAGYVDITTLGRLRQVSKGLNRALKNVVTAPVRRIREYITRGAAVLLDDIPTRILDDMYACFPFYYRRYCMLVQEQYDKYNHTRMLWRSNKTIRVCVNNKVYVKPSTRYVGDSYVGNVDLYTGCVFKPDAKKKPRGNIFLASPSPLIGISSSPGYSLYSKDVPKDRRHELVKLERWYTHISRNGASVDKPVNWRKPFQHPFKYMKSKWRQFNKR